MKQLFFLLTLSTVVMQAATFTNSPKVYVPSVTQIPSPSVPVIAMPQVNQVETPPVAGVNNPFDPLPAGNNLTPLMKPVTVLPSAQEIISKGLRMGSTTRPIAQPTSLPFTQATKTVHGPTTAWGAFQVAKPILFNTTEADTILKTLQVFPPDNAWNTDVSMWPTHPNSRAIIASIGANAPLRCNEDMGFVCVPPDQKRVAVKIVDYPDESDHGPFPVPDNVPIEGWPKHPKGATLDEVQRDTRNEGGDRHGIVVDPTNRILYEFYQLKRTTNGWQAAQSSIFDLKTNKLRPDGWTSADAAGLPIFPAIVRYDDIARGVVNHAMRVTVRRTCRAYVAPATHFASRLTDPNLPRMGERIRLHHDFSTYGFSPEAQAILNGLKKYGMLVADNGMDWGMSIAPDERIRSLHDELRKVHGSDFEVVVAP